MRVKAKHGPVEGPLRKGKKFDKTNTFRKEWRKTKLMKKFAILALALAMAIPASAAGVTISGYIDVGYLGGQNGNVPAATVLYTGPGQAVGSTNATYTDNDGFSFNELNLDVAAQLTSDISAFGSIDFIPARGTAGSDVVLDYAYVDFANPGPFDLNVRVGRIPSVIGIEQRASESNQTKFISLSNVSPATVGSMEGLAIYGSFSPVNYALAVSNSDNFGTDSMLTSTGNNNMWRPAGNNRGSAYRTGLDNNNSKSISGRLGVVPIEGLEVGVSGSWGKWAAPAAAAGVAGSAQGNNANRSLFGVDLSYVWGALTIKGEYAQVTEDQTSNLGSTTAGNANQELRMKAWYIEAMYDINSKYSVGARWNENKLTQQSYPNQIFGGQSNVAAYNTLTVAGDMRITDNVVLKGEYSFNDEDLIYGQSVPGQQATNKIKNDAYALSLVGSF